MLLGPIMLFEDPVAVVRSLQRKISRVSTGIEFWEEG